MRRFRLSLFAHATSLMAVAALAALGVCFELHRSVLQETLFSVLALWALFAVYFSFLLYFGVRFDRGLVEGWFTQYFRIFRRGLRLVMRYVKLCRGSVLKSFRVAALHSLGYAVLLGGVVYASEFAFRCFRHSGGA